MMQASIGTQSVHGGIILKLILPPWLGHERDDGLNAITVCPWGKKK